MFMSCRFPLQPRHVDGVLYVDFYGISTVNNRQCPDHHRYAVSLFDGCRESGYGDACLEVVRSGYD